MAEQVNDINVPKIKELDAMVRATPGLGKVKMKATSTWHRGTKCFVSVGSAQALGQDLFPRTRRWVVMTDDPDVFGGVDAAPTPAETLIAARPRFARHFHGGGEGRAAGNADENAFALGERARGFDGFGIIHGQDAVGHVAVEHGRHEVRRPALDLVRRERLAT